MRSAKKTSKKRASKINHKKVEGLGHVQPEPNPWIGVFKTGDDLLEGTPLGWKSQVVQYEGPFECGDECINGTGRAKVTHVRCSEKGGRVIVTLKGMGKPKLEKKVRRKKRFGYNPNLPIIEGKLQRPRKLK